jgi:hemin uptake protein HemP
VSGQTTTHAGVGGGLGGVPFVQPGLELPLAARGPAEHNASPDAATGHHPVVASDTLLKGGKALCIAHNGTVYRLQATRLGKLILTK